MGGGAVWEYGGNTVNTTFSKRVAAIVPMCGAVNPLAARAHVISANKLAVWAFHNDKDPIAPVYYTNHMVNLINSDAGASIPARKTIFASTKHDCWTQAYNPAYQEDGANIYEWMLNYKRSVQDKDIVLPLNWLDFTGERRHDGVFVSWRTANETKTEMFIIERSLDGISFNGIGVVEALGGSSSPNRYNYTDVGTTTLGAPLLYYRIKQVDDNGQFSYSKTVAVKVERNSSTASITAYPNPFSKTLRVQLTTAGPLDDISGIEVFSLQGSLVFSRQIHNRGSQTVILNEWEGIPSGIYLLKITIKGSEHTIRVLKE